MRIRTDNLAWKFRRFAVNMNYRLGSFRLQGGRSIRTWLTAITFITIAFSIFILAGGVFDMLERPLALIPRGRSGYTFLYPGNIHFQTSLESILSGLLYVLGLGGLYLLLRSTRLAYRPRRAYSVFLVGMVLLLTSVLYAQAILQQKVGG